MHPSVSCFTAVALATVWAGWSRASHTLLLARSPPTPRKFSPIIRGGFKGMPLPLTLVQNLTLTRAGFLSTELASVVRC